MLAVTHYSVVTARLDQVLPYDWPAFTVTRDLDSILVAALDVILEYLRRVVDNLYSIIILVYCIPSDIRFNLQIRCNRSALAETHPVVRYLRL